jgi:hypothetical protein
MAPHHRQNEATFAVFGMQNEGDPQRRSAGGAPALEMAEAPAPLLQRSLGTIRSV